MGRVLPILFNGDMVRAILDGRKTVTRRVIKPRYRNDECDFQVVVNKATGERRIDTIDDGGFVCRTAIRPPYQPGDIMYVRETWAEWTDGYVYRTWISPFPQAGCYPTTVWRPSIHMPKQAARIWLKVTDVRAERLQEIDGRGILAEGIDNGKSNPKMRKRWENMQRIGFSGLWDSTIKKSDLERYGWDANPWVWVIEFERCGKPEPCILNGIEPASDRCPCIGYQKSKEDDEPYGICKGCKWCDSEEAESEER